MKKVHEIAQNSGERIQTVKGMFYGREGPL
jgi:hypothetical protein